VKALPDALDVAIVGGGMLGLLLVDCVGIVVRVLSPI
jgi:hypothetical protein